jgi:outer membrane protein insertion porin family
MPASLVGTPAALGAMPAAKRGHGLVFHAEMRVTARRRRRLFPRVRAGLAVGLIWCVGAEMGRAQEAEPKIIRSVEFVGLVRASPSYAQDVAGIKPGDAFNVQALEEAVNRLLRTRRFLSASHETIEEPDGVRVVIHVRERILVSAMRFEGNKKFRERQLAELVPLKVGDPVDAFAVRDGREAITAKYHEAGYSDVQVSYDQERLDGTGELVYRIDEGGRVKVTRIAFQGHTAFTERQLKKQIETKTAIWIFRVGAFDEDRAETDSGRLQSFCRDEGFLDARVSYRVEPSEKPGELTLFFTIDEGVRYVIEDIRIRGHAAFSTEQLLGMMKSRVGGFVRQSEVDADLRAIRTLYGEQGYIDATVRGVRVFSDQPERVILNVDIHEGEQFRVGRVVVRGNTRTKDKVVRRALNLYPPDDLFNLTEAREAEKRLVETRIFKSARVIPVGDQPGVRDAVVDVAESDRMGDLLFGVGVTSNSGLIGSIVLDLHNFDLFDTPRTWSEFFKFRAFTGGGQRLRIELLPGTEVSRFNIDFTEPFLFDRPIRLDTGFYYFQRDRDGYEERRVGSTVSFGKRFQRGRLRGWTGEVAFRAEDVNVDDVDVFASKEIREDEGSNLLTSVKGTLVRDRTDNRLIPTTGDRFRVACEQFGGDHSFGRITSSYVWYKTLRTDALDRKGVLQLRAEGGAIVGDAPVFERFYAGGTGSLRGFAFRGVGPRDGLDDNNIGGEWMVLLGSEYSFPVYAENVRGLFFIDSGMVGNGPWRAAFGTGIRLTLDLFGPLPLEFTLGFPVSKDGDDDTQVFGFVVGSIF